MKRDLQRFVITGLPRCRSGWLSNLMTYGSSFCGHDFLQYGKNFWGKLDEIASNDDNILYVGNSDTGIPLLYEPHDFTDCKILVVLRDTTDALENYIAYFQKHPYPQIGIPDREKMLEIFQTIKDRLARFCAMPNCKTVLFDHLNHKGVVKDVVNWLTPGERFNEDRWELLDKLRVNPCSQKVRVA